MVKIYSINKIAWLTSHNIEVNLDIDEEGKCFVTVEEDVTELLRDFKNNLELMNFLRTFKAVRNQIRMIKGEIKA